jgi:hypothetical protein
MAAVILPIAGSPLGIGAVIEPITQRGDLVPILADKIAIDTNDFESVFEPDDIVDAQVKIAMKTVRGSGVSVINTGHRFDKVEKLDETVPDQLRRETKIALQLLVQNGDISVVRIKVLTADEADGDPGPGFDWAEVQVDYKNLRTREKQARSVSKRIADIRRLANR